MQVALNSKIEFELAKALKEYAKQTNLPKNAIITMGLMKVIPPEILISNGAMLPADK
jgi:hypothetical protein